MPLFQLQDHLLAVEFVGPAQQEESDRDFALVRLLPNGAFDTAFGEGGVVTTPIGDDNDGSFSMALAPDGRIVLAGETDNGVDFDLAVARFHP